MKTLQFPRLIVLGTLACCALTAPQLAIAQPEAPVATDAATAKPEKAKKEGKPMHGKKSRGKVMTPRLIEATEAALDKPLSPEQKELIIVSMRERDTLIKAANDGHYARFAQVTGLTPEQAKEIDKTARNGAGADKPTKPKVDGQTDMNALSDANIADGAPVTPR